MLTQEQKAKLDSKASIARMGTDSAARLQRIAEIVCLCRYGRMTFDRAMELL